MDMCNNWEILFNSKDCEHLFTHLFLHKCKAIPLHILPSQCFFYSVLGTNPRAPSCPLGKISTSKPHVHLYLRKPLGLKKKHSEQRLSRGTKAAGSAASSLIKRMRSLSLVSVFFIPRVHARHSVLVPLEPWPYF